MGFGVRMNTMIESGDWDFNEDIEKFWRERFADQIEQTLMHQIPDFDTETEWFNKGMRHAAWVLRYGRDDLGWEKYD
jgi:hypothetical protein